MFAAPCCSAWAAGELPQRVVSINLCTDQLVLAGLPRERIAAVSALADDPALSAHADDVWDLPMVEPRAEEILALQPDLVLTGAFGQDRLVAQLEAVGIRVVRFPDAMDFDDIRRTYRQAAALFDAGALSELAEGAIRDRLGAIAPGSRGTALMLSPGLFAQAEGMLGDVILRVAGYTNAASRLTGNGYVTLERIVADPPDFIFLLQSAGQAAPSRANLLLSHPVIAARSRVVAITEAGVICGTPATAGLALRLSEVAP